MVYYFQCFKCSNEIDLITNGVLRYIKLGSDMCVLCNPCISKDASAETIDHFDGGKIVLISDY